MHKRFIAISIAAILLGGATLFLAQKQSTAPDTSTDQPKSPLSVHTESVAERQTVSFEFSSPGTVASEGEASLVAQVSGTITHTNFVLNQSVTMNQSLLSIDEASQGGFAPAIGLQSSDLKTAYLTLQNAKRAYQEAVHQDNQKKSATSENAKIEAENSRDIAALAYQALLDKRLVKSPITGTVTVKNVSVGDSVVSGTPLATISRGRKVIRFFVSDTERLLFTIGQTVSFTKDTQKTNLLHGQILRVSQAADPVSRRFLVEAESTDPNFKDFSAGSIVTVFATISKQARSGNFFLPQSALLLGQNGNAVLVYDNGTARRVSVDIQDIDGETVELSGIIDPNVRIITTLVKRLKDGDAVTTD